MWNVTAFICILIGASIPLDLIDASLAMGLVGAATSLVLMALVVTAVGLYLRRRDAAPELLR